MNKLELKSTLDAMILPLDKALLDVGMHFDTEVLNDAIPRKRILHLIRSYSSGPETRKLDITFNSDGSVSALLKDTLRVEMNHFFFSQVLNPKTDFFDVCDRLPEESAIAWMKRGGEAVIEAISGSLKATLEGKEWPNVTPWNPRDHGY